MWLLHLLAQTSGNGGDVLGSILTGLGSAGVATAMIWKLHTDAVKRHAEEMHDAESRFSQERVGYQKQIDSLTTRLFLLADTGAKVAQAAHEVVREETARDPGLALQLERIEAQIQEMGRRQ